MVAQGVTIIDEPEDFESSVLFAEEVQQSDSEDSASQEECLAIDEQDEETLDAEIGELPAMSKMQKIILIVCCVAAIATLVYLFLMWFIL